MIKTISNATEFGKVVQKALIDREMSQSELMTAVHEDTGLCIDSSYLHRILKGKRNAPKIVASIKKILELA